MLTRRPCSRGQFLVISTTLTNTLMVTVNTPPGKLGAALRRPVWHRLPHQDHLPGPARWDIQPGSAESHQGKTLTRNTSHSSPRHLMLHLDFTFLHSIHEFHIVFSLEFSPYSQVFLLLGSGFCFRYYVVCCVCSQCLFSITKLFVLFLCNIFVIFDFLKYFNLNILP